MFRSLLFWLVLSSGITFLWPADQVGFDPFPVSKPMLWCLVAITMFSLGSLVRPSELGPLRERPWWVALGVAAQVLIMPAAAWLVTRLIPMDEGLAAGVVLVGCVPGAMASNVLTHTAGGSVAFSVSLTTVATLLSPITVPTVLSIVAGAQTEQSMASSALILAVLVALPTIVGYVVSRKFRPVRNFADNWSSVIASIALLWIIAAVVASTRDLLMGVGVILVVALLMVNLLGYLSGYSLGRSAGLPQPYCRALSLEVGMQNAGLGTALAATLYADQPSATIPTAAYTFGCMLTGTLLAIVWRHFDRTANLAGGDA